MRTTAVEINPSVIAACRQWFRLPPDGPRLTVLNQDARQWVDDPAHLQTVDALNVDLYDHEAASPVLDDGDFYAACRSVLQHGGLMTVNLFGRRASFARSSLRIAKVFGSDQVWQLTPTKEGNTVLVAGRSVRVPTAATLLARAATIESRYRLPARKWLRLVRPLPMSILQGLRHERQDRHHAQAHAWRQSPCFGRQARRPARLAQLPALAAGGWPDRPGAGAAHRGPLRGGRQRLAPAGAPGHAEPRAPGQWQAAGRGCADRMAGQPRACLTCASIR